MLRKLAIFTTLILCASSAQAVTFYSISSIESTTQATDFLPAINLIQGTGVGFDGSEPHDQITDGLNHLWITDAPAGFPADYIAAAGMPILTIDLGIDVLLSEISVWGNPDSNANGVAEFSLRFATEADTASGFGNSIDFNPTYFPINSEIPRQSFAFGQTVAARYVEFTINDNFFIAPGDGSGGGVPGGDRVGLGEIAFATPAAVPVPAAVWLFGSALLGLGVIKRKKRVNKTS